MDFFAEQFKTKPEDLYAMFGDKLIDDYGTLYDAFAAVSNGQEDLSTYVSDEKLRAAVIKAITENITPTLVTIKGYVEISSEAGDGVQIVKDALIEGEKTFKDVDGKITYVAPPKYRIDLTADDYKTAEKQMKNCYDAIEKYAASKGIETHFERKLKQAS